MLGSRVRISPLLPVFKRPLAQAWGLFCWMALATPSPTPGAVVTFTLTRIMVFFQSGTSRLYRNIKLKKLLLVALIGFAAWKLYGQQNAAGVFPSLDLSSGSASSSETQRTASTRFTCDGRQHCSQMNSRAEAEFFTRHCPNTKMDGDRDGIPCENDSRF